MLTPNQLKEYRKRAFALLLQRADKTIPMLIDYQIDSALRGLFGLPDRPDNQMPYIGWMTPVQKIDQGKMKTSNTGIRLIKQFEGFRKDAYLCPAKVWTIGYGHTGNVLPSHTISELQAEKLLQKDLERFERAVNELVKVNLNQNQFDALVSFVYNVGITAFKESTLLKVLNQGLYQKAGLQFGNWVHGGGKKLPGLIRRRKAEHQLFITS